MQDRVTKTVRSSAIGKLLKQKKSSCQAQLHLPALDLFQAELLRESPTDLPPLVWEKWDKLFKALKV